MILLPYQNILLIKAQQTRIVVVSISLVTATTVIVAVTIHIVGTNEIVKTIHVC